MGELVSEEDRRSTTRSTVSLSSEVSEEENAGKEAADKRGQPEKTSNGQDEEWSEIRSGYYQRRKKIYEMPAR